jgi:hypothetical protein
MTIRAWLLRLAVSGTLVAGAAIGGGWKWDRVLPF